jgi:hypothetical protein
MARTAARSFCTPTCRPSGRCACRATLPTTRAGAPAACMRSACRRARCGSGARMPRARGCGLFDGFPRSGLFGRQPRREMAVAAFDLAARNGPRALLKQLAVVQRASAAPGPSLREPLPTALEARTGGRQWSPARGHLRTCWAATPRRRSGAPWRSSAARRSCSRTCRRALAAQGRRAPDCHAELLLDPSGVSGCARVPGQ